MRRGLTTLSALCIAILTAVFLTAPASAAQQSMPSLTTIETKELTTPVRYRYRQYCVRQYFKCRDRWGQSRRFRRCMKWRGCWDAYVEFRERRERRRERRRYDDDDEEEGGYSCRRWKNACSENWGYDNSDYYGCLRYHGCN
ncbi:MAG: hypothetical protein KTR19_07685 [Hyphomicrobiales bacterium]|nr:hypothetical protein [Hyphomicrobiales bacterium]